MRVRHSRIDKDYSRKEHYSHSLQAYWNRHDFLMVQGDKALLSFEQKKLKDLQVLDRVGLVTIDFSLCLWSTVLLSLSVKEEKLLVSFTNSSRKLT